MQLRPRMDRIGFASKLTIQRGIQMKNLLALLFAASFAVVSVGSFAAEPAKDAKAVDCKDPKNKDHKDCATKMKK